jgi:uncharacterized protein (TIGR03083 family)
MRPAGRIEVLDLFPDERAALLELLQTLHADEWGLPTICDGWSVRDIAAHVVADDLGRLSRARDGHNASWIEAASWQELVREINAQNEAWVGAMRRLSPKIVLDMLRYSGEQTQAHFETLDLDEIGAPVDWAGREPAPRWLDLAREYTERWAHQQQIRDAVGKPGLKDRRMFAPVLECYVRALPHTYRDVLAPDGTHVRLRITGAAGDTWSLVRIAGKWGLYLGVETEPEASVTLDQEEAWRLFTRGTTPEAARAWAVFTGDAALAGRVLDAVAVIA